MPCRIFSKQHKGKGRFIQTFTGQFFVNKKTFALALVLIAGFKARLAGLNLGYPENPALKPRKAS